jgi:hypothetical protein
VGVSFRFNINGVCCGRVAGEGDDTRNGFV